MQMPNRGYTASQSFRYGFNGKENDNEVKGTGNELDYGMRIYDPRIMKFLSIDPLTKKYPELTPYQFASNTPIMAVDLDGKERLDMTGVNATKRTATITVVKQVDIVQAGLVTELQGLNSTSFSQIFTKGNTTLYTRSLPENGQPIDFISQADYNQGVGYAIDVKYDLKIDYIKAAANSKHYLPDHSIAFMGTKTHYSGNSTFAASGTASNDIAVNPSFDAFSINAGLPINENYEELIAHEVGYHNMMGLSHTADKRGHAIYPKTPGLENATHGNIYPTDSDTKKMLQKNVTDRQNLVNVDKVNQALSVLATIKL